MLCTYCMPLFCSFLMPQHKRGEHPLCLLWPLHDIRLYVPGLCTSQFYYWHDIPPLFHTPVFRPHTIACNVWFPLDAPLVCQAPYSIGNGNLV